MRKVPVLTAVCLLAICSLAVAPVYAGTAMANDPPSISLPVGTNAPDAFNINDFFVDPTGATIDGGSLGADGSATVDGLSAAGTADYSISAGAESGAAQVWASSAKFGNRPQIDNNNRLVGVAGGNLFANWGSSSSSLPLGSVGGGSGTPGGSTPGGGAVVVSVGEVSLSSEGTWRKRSSGPADTGVSATIDADGNYSIDVADGASASIVSFSVAGVDAVQVLAAPATEVGAPIVGTHTVAAGANNLVIGTEPVAVGEYAQLELTYNASSADGVAIAVIGFDGAVAFQSATYSNPSGPGLQAGVDKNLATSVRSAAGSVIPAVQVFNGGSAPVTVTISRFAVAQARPLVDYAINPNATVVNNPLDSTDGLIPDILAQGAGGPVAGDGVIALNGQGGVANASIQATLGQGTCVAECYVQRVGAADDGAAFVVNVTDGGALSFAQFVPGSGIPTDSFWKVQAVGTVQADGTAAFVTLQAAGVNVNVDNLVIREIDQADNQFDANLL
jgi:hypothetical protein